MPPKTKTTKRSFNVYKKEGLVIKTETKVATSPKQIFVGAFQKAEINKLQHLWWKMFCLL